MKQNAYEQAIACVMGANDPVICLVGPACRSWYVDIARIRGLLADLFEVRPFSVLHGGRHPFDMYVQQSCDELGIEAMLVGPPDLSIRLTKEYTRDPGMVEGTTLLIAFPAEEPGEGKKAGKIFPPESADLDVVRCAWEHQVPVLAVYRDGHAEFRGGTGT